MLQSSAGSAAFTLKALFDGRYILLPGDPKNVLLISDELVTLVPEPGTWLSRDFYKFGNIQSISVAATNGLSAIRPRSRKPWRIAL